MDVSVFLATIVVVVVVVVDKQLIKDTAFFYYTYYTYRLIRLFLSYFGHTFATPGFNSVSVKVARGNTGTENSKEHLTFKCDTVNEYNNE